MVTEFVETSTEARRGPSRLLKPRIGPYRPLIPTMVLFDLIVQILISPILISPMFYTHASSSVRIARG